MIKKIKKTRKLLKGKNKIKIMVKRKKIMIIKARILWKKKMMVK